MLSFKEWIVEEAKKPKKKKEVKDVKSTGRSKNCRRKDIQLQEFLCVYQQHCQHFAIQGVLYEPVFYMRVRRRAIPDKVDVLPKIST
jgi:hypothetical protein